MLKCRRSYMHKGSQWIEKFPKPDWYLRSNFSTLDLIYGYLRIYLVTHKMLSMILLWKFIQRGRFKSLTQYSFSSTFNWEFCLQTTLTQQHQSYPLYKERFDIQKTWQYYFCDSSLVFKSITPKLFGIVRRSYFLVTLKSQVGWWFRQ